MTNNEYRLLCLMVADLNDMINNYDISEWECNGFKNTVISEIESYNEKYGHELELRKVRDKYKLVY